MYNKIVTIWDELVRVSILLLQNMHSARFLTLFVDHSFDISSSDLACLYLYDLKNPLQKDLSLHYTRGNHKAVKDLPVDSDFVSFLRESKQAIILSEMSIPNFSQLLLTKEMHSGVALPIGSESQQFGILILNSLHDCHYTQERFEFLNKLSMLVGEMFGYRLNRRKFQKQRIL